MREDTTINVKRTTKSKMNKFKLINDETYDSLIIRLLDELERLRNQ